MNFPEKARRVIELEIEELNRLRDRVGETFTEAVQALLNCLAGTRKIVVCGVGKSGNIGRKLVATLNSTGATSVNLNAQDALHGDLGVLDDGDTVILLSYSGETQELIDLLPHLRRHPVTLIAITGNSQSTLARNSDIVLDSQVQREACPLNLAPTSSTTTMLVLCDALAMVLLEARGFREEDFAKYHPSGALGRALLTKVSDVMRSGASMAVATPETSIQEVLQAMTRARSGAAVVVQPDGKLAGVFTHGDFVRAFQADPNIAAKPVEPFMTRNPISITAGKLAAEVLAVLEQHRVDDLVVLDEFGHPVGLVDTQDLTRMKLV
ncbi:MAG: SIS domain-containing protein [Verrucomicrobium sp.]|nr:KpsF/GutQ family sugar-phosphate isomerase [Verrucomicrobium sp.]